MKRLKHHLILKEVFPMLGISRRTLMNWVKAGEVKTEKRGKYRFVPMTEIERLLNGR